jgi:ornithine cyclodeaminase/alanine dehydrogenase
MPLILSRRDLIQILDMPEVIAAVEAGFRQHAEGQVRAPVRLPLPVPNSNGIFLFMPAYAIASEALGTKIVSVYSDNPKRGLPLIFATILLNDPATGELLALMDGTYITGIRTAATSAVATKHLANPDAKVLGIFGAGVQGRFHLWAMLTVTPTIARVFVNDLDPARARTFADEMEVKHRVEVIATTNPAEVVRQADIVCTCTTSTAPVLAAPDLKAGTHINAVGAYTPQMRELDTATVQRACVVVDTYDEAFTEAGDILIPISEGVISREHVLAQLGEVVVGKRVRHSPNDITLFKAVGFAMEDAVTARLAYDKARERGIGFTSEL